MTFINDLNEPVNLVPDATDAAKAARAKAEKDQNDRNEFQTAEAIAELTYESERTWEKIIGDPPRPAWDELAADRQKQRIDDVVWMLSHASASVAQQHDAWRARKMSQPVPSTVSANAADQFDNLSWAQQRKAWIARHLAHAIVG
jgi:hypothetical protein